MQSVTPKVFIIAKSAPTREMRDWLDYLDASNFQIPATTIGTLLTTVAGKRCYLSFRPGLNPNVEKVRNDLSAFIDNILKVGHGSVLEHVSYTFAIEGVSRIFTAEMNRHRAGVAVSEGSLRYIRLSDFSYVMPPSLEDNAEDSKATLFAKRRTRDLFNRAFSQMEGWHDELEEIWDYEDLTSFTDKKHLTSLFRRIVGMGVATGGVWTFNLRALRHIFTMRCDPSAEEEILHVASLILQRMIEAEPEIFGDFHLEDGYWKPRYRKV